MNDSEITLATVFHMVKGIKDELGEIKGSITTIKQNLNGLNKDVAMLKDDMKGVHKYIKMESNFQEVQNRNFISKIYLHNHPHHSIDIIHINKFFNSRNREITDFDGFLLIRMYPSNLPPPSSNLLSRIPDQSFVSSLKANQENHHKQHAYVIIESKHSLCKGKVDLKIRQMIEVREVLQIKDEQHPSGGQAYRTMMNRIETDTSLRTLYHPIHLIFSSDDISNELREYIIAIYEGLDEKKYDQLTSRLFYSDPYIQQVIADILSNPTITAKYKSYFTTHQPISYIREAFRNKPFEPHKTPYVSSYLQPFSALKNIFHEMKGFVGISQFNTVYFPSLFQRTSLNQNTI